MIMILRAVDKAWIDKALERAGISQAELARRINIDPTGMSRLVNGKRILQAHEASQMATTLAVPLEEVLRAFDIRVSTHSPASPNYHKVRVRGHIHGGGVVVLYPSDETGTGLETVECPFSHFSGYCLRVVGNDASPRYVNGDLIGYTPGGNPERLVGREAIVCFENGAMALKRVSRGTDPGRYTLISLVPFAEPIQNVSLRWASAIQFHIPPGEAATLAS